MIIPLLHCSWLLSYAFDISENTNDSVDRCRNVDCYRCSIDVVLINGIKRGNLCHLPKLNHAIFKSSYLFRLHSKPILFIFQTFNIHRIIIQYYSSVAIFDLIDYNTTALFDQIAAKKCIDTIGWTSIQVKTI